MNRKLTLYHTSTTTTYVICKIFNSNYCMTNFLQNNGIQLWEFIQNFSNRHSLARLWRRCMGILREFEIKAYVCRSCDLWNPDYLVSIWAFLVKFRYSWIFANITLTNDVDALKFQLVRHDIFYNGQNQQDSTECLLMIINIIDKGSMPDSSSTTSPMGASLSDLLFSFVLEKYIVCEVCGLRSPSFESSSVLHISPTDTPSMQNFILEGLQQKLQKSCSRCNKNTRHIE